MQITSAGASKLIKRLKDDFDSLIKHESETKQYSYIEGEEPLIYPYDFEVTQAQLTATNDRIAKIRHAVNQFNVSTTLPGFDFTIDEALVRLAMMNEDKYRLGKMRGVLERTRRSAYRNGESVPEYTVRNYDEVLVDREYRELTKRISEIQQALDLVNLTERFEIPD